MRYFYIILFCATFAFGQAYVRNVYTAGTAAQQTISQGSLSVIGTYTLKSGNSVAIDIPYNASAGAVQAKIRTIGFPSATVSGTYSTDYTVVFTGYNGPVSNLEVVNSTVSSDYQVQNIDFSNAPNYGTYAISFDGSVATGVSFDASTAALQGKIRTLTGLQSADVTGTAGASYDITLTGYAGDAPLLQIVSNDMTIYAEQELHFDSEPVSGDFSLAYGGVGSGNIVASGDATAVQTALRTIPALSLVTVSGESSTDYTVAFKGVRGVASILVVSSDTTTRNLSVVSTVSGDATDADVTEVSPASSVDITVATTVPGVKTGIPTTSEWMELVTSLQYGVNSVQVYDSSGATLLLGYGPVGQEQGIAIVVPGGGGTITAPLPNKARIVLKSLSTPPASGEIDINFQRN